MNKNTQCTWHWQVEAYDVSKWASAGIKGRLWNTSYFFFFRGLCFWSVSFFKHFRRCADPCQHFWHQWHTRLMRWTKRTRALFSRELGRSSAPRGSGPDAAEAVRRRLRLRRLQMELANESERGIFISRSSAADESELLEEDVLSVTSSDPAGSALLAHGGLMKAEMIFLSLLSLSAPRM